jgi:hypothetical protein
LFCFTFVRLQSGVENGRKVGLRYGCEGGCRHDGSWRGGYSMMVDDEKKTPISSRPSLRPSTAHEPRGNSNERPGLWTFPLACCRYVVHTRYSSNRFPSNTLEQFSDLIGNSAAIHQDFTRAHVLQLCLAPTAPCSHGDALRVNLCSPELGEGPGPKAQTICQPGYVRLDV